MASIFNFAEQLDKQLRFLETSCREYDAGNLDEAIRIGTALRILFHHTARSTSLLFHLGATHIKMLSTAGTRPSNDPRGYWPGLVQIEIDVALRTVRGKPKFDATPSAHRMMPFSAWWDSETVYFGGGKKIKRKDVVLDAVHKDGGAHVDDDVPAKYRFFLDGAEFSLTVENPSGDKTISRLATAHLACLRQIAYEVLNSPGIRSLQAGSVP